MTNLEIRQQLDLLMYTIREFYDYSSEEDYEEDDVELYHESIKVYKHLRSYFKDDNN
jgi:site-specific recombinase XerD